MSAVQILLVEDDEIDWTAFQRGMQRCGMTNKLVVAENGIEALKILKGTQI